MKKIYLFIIIFVAVLSSCTDKFSDFNEDQKNPAMVTGEALFSNAQKDLTDQISSTNVNENVFKIWSQYWTETTYTDEANYDIVTRNIPDVTFNRYYLRILKDLQESETLIKNAPDAYGADPNVKQNKLYIIQLVRAYAYQQLVDVFGAVPYTDALNSGNVYPKYDNGYEIYKDLISKVNASVAGLKSASASFGGSDLYYQGDVSKWIKFGNSLKIKLGIAIADYDNALAKTTVEAGVAGGAFTSSSDDCLLPYLQSSPNYNPLYADLVASGRDDFVPANTIVDIMNSLSDPRRDAYFSNQIDTSTVSGVSKLAYVGGQYGYSSPFGDYSHIAAAIQKPDFKGILFTYSEVQFYLAEAAARGYNVPKTAENYYNEGIRASFAFWGVSDVDSYLANPDVAYSTAPGTWKQKIALQAWLALYTRGLEGI